MTPDRSARISAIIPIYGQTSNLPRLLDKLDQQTLKPPEIILVDSSTAPLEKVPPGVRYLKNPVDMALSGDYNHGAQHAAGDLLLLMQQDCLPSRQTDLENNLKLLTQERVAV